jgi:type I restriction enzyme S subunit
MSVKRVEGAELVLAPTHLALVRRLLRAHAPRHRAYAFGSRVIASPADRARLKPHADLDLALDGPPLQPAQVFALREAFSESDLPMRVDIVDASDLPATWDIRTWPV